MPKPILFRDGFEALTLKLTTLAKVAPHEVKALEVLIDEALARHCEEARVKRFERFRRLK